MRPAIVARRMGVSIKTLRYYEKRGLLRPRRTAKGWRVYDEAEVDRLAQIAAYQSMGFGLSQIGALLDATPEAMAAALAQQELDLGEQIAEMQRAVERVREALEAAEQPGESSKQGEVLECQTGPRLVRRDMGRHMERGDGHGVRLGSSRRPALPPAQARRKAA